MKYFDKKYLLLFFFCCFSLSLLAQDTISVEGIWTGTITQASGYRTRYGVELFLKKDGNKLTGRSYVFVDDIYAEMIVEGEIHSDIIVLLKDVSIVEDEIIEGMEWCMKSFQLVLKREGDTWRLDGRWQGKTSFSDCVPGEVRLEKVVPRA